MRKAILFGIVVSGIVFPASGASFYPTRLEDPKAVYLTPDRFPVRADGLSDDSAALQAAIDKVQSTTGEGILFVPEGRYRITKTIYVWSGVRVIGYGAKRPVLLLPDRTPGYQEGIGYMVFFSGGRPLPQGVTAGRGGAGGGRGPARTFTGTVPPTAVADSSPGTFYSAMSNIDFEIGAGNEAAVAIRFHVAQHGYLSHMDFHIGSGLAGLHDVGNEGEDLHFFGGRYGILTRKPTAAWQFTLLDSTFDGQREAGIRENEAQLTLVHNEFRNMPTAIAIDPRYSDQLYVKDARFENISGPAVLISNENNRMTQVNMENIVCSRVPVFAQFRESGRKLAGVGDMYTVQLLAHGLTLPSPGGIGTIKTRYTPVALKTLPAPLPNVIRALPPAGAWVNLQSLGIKGDGVTDETAAIRKAIAEHPVLYIPSGHYVVSDTLKLRPDSVIIALHPDQTQLDLLDSTPAFQGPGAPVPVLEAPRGGDNIVVGIGIYTNGINSRAVGALWMAGKDSLMNDVRFLGGHGTNGLDGRRVQPYATNLFSDPNALRRWDGQYHSLWITHGGGGTFANIWTPDSFAQSGLYISDTTTPGKVFQLSSEHHVRTEIKLDQVENWDLYALQTEGEREESASGIALEIRRSKNIAVANLHAYRVVRSYHPVRQAILMQDSSNIRFRNMHVDNNSSAASCGPGGCRQIVRSAKVSFENCILDEGTGAQVRDREFAWLDYGSGVAATATAAPSTVLEPAAKVTKLSSGFYNASGGAVDAAGRLYFVDSHFQRIYRWTPDTRKLEVIRDNPLDPVNLAFDKAGNLIVVSSGGRGLTVYSIRPDGPEDEVTVLQPQPPADRSGMTALLPTNYWVNADFLTDVLDTKTYEYTSLDQMFTKLVTTRRTSQYVSPDGTTFIPSDDAYVQPAAIGPYKFGHILQAYGLVKAVPGKPFYVTNESEQRTYTGKVMADGTLSGVRVFAEQGGENLATDAAGNVYMAAGQVFVYNPAGKVIDVIRVPERPIQLVFGGKDGRTLFILTQNSLYSVRTRSAGL